jgi:hypothetical protein
MSLRNTQSVLAEWRFTQMLRSLGRVVAVPLIDAARRRSERSALHGQVSFGAVPKTLRSGTTRYLSFSQVAGLLVQLNAVRHASLLLGK